MKFVDEFRDAELGRVLAGEILATVEPGRHYKIMEVCGGHTHSIYKYGVDDLLPDERRARPRAGLPGLRDPDGPRRRRHRDRARAGRDLHLLRRHAARARRARDDARREGRRRRHPHRLLAARRAADRAREPGPRGRLLRDRLRDDGAVDRADAEAGEGRGDPQLLGACATTSRSCRRCGRCSSRPTCGSTASSGPGHVSHGRRLPARSSSSRPTTASRSWSPGFEPVDLLQSVLMILRQLAEGRCEVENQYSARRPVRGQPARAAGDGRGVRAAAALRVARARLHLAERACACRDAYRDLDAELRFAVPGVRVADPKACQCGEVLKGVIKPWECKVFGTACTPEHADRHVHGLARGRLRRVLQLRALRARAGGRVMPRRRHARRARAARPRPASRRPAAEAAEVPRRAHHDGARRRRQGDADADRGPARAGVRVGRAGGARRRRPGRVGGARLAFTTDSFVVKPIRFPGGSIGELAVNGTVNDLADGGRAAARADARDGARGGPRRRRPARRGGGDRAPRPRAAGVQIVAGDTKVVERGHCDAHVPLHGRHRAASTSAPRCRPRRCSPGDRILVSGTIGDHGTAIMLARGEFELDADGRVGHALAVAGRRRAARRRRARRCTACATRPAAASRRC